MFCDAWLAPLMQLLIALVFVLGVGTEAPSRNSTRMLRVNSSFLRRSGVRNAEANAPSTGPPATGFARFVGLAGRAENSARPAARPTLDGPDQANSPNRVPEITD